MIISHALRPSAAADLEGFAHSAAAVRRLAPGVLDWKTGGLEVCVWETGGLAA